MFDLLVHNAQLLSVEDGRLTPNAWIRVSDGRIHSTGTGLDWGQLSAGTHFIDAEGGTLVPGFIDAHVHLLATSLDQLERDTWTPGYAMIRSLELAHRMLRRGFTTVRDVGGADHGLARVLDEGRLPGPRLLHGGYMISQTGGHGDLRPRSQAGDCHCAEISGVAVIVDGVAQMQKTVREQLRQGASHIKLAVSGGVASPHDEISAVQYSEEEIRAAVVEAENANSYVTVHAYHPRAIAQAIRAGVHCVEHGNLLDADTARQMAEKDIFLVPTLVTYELLASQGATAGLEASSVGKVATVRDYGLAAFKLAYESGVPIAFGTDLLGPMEAAQLGEFQIRSQIVPPLEVIRQATVYAARLLRMEGQLGTLGEGAIADILVLDGNPQEDISILLEPEKYLKYVIQAGKITATPALDG